MALNEMEKKEINALATKARTGLVLTDVEEARYLELETKERAERPQISVRTIWDLPIAESMFAADARDMGW